MKPSSGFTHIFSPFIFLQTKTSMREKDGQEKARFFQLVKEKSST